MANIRIKHPTLDDGRVVEVSEQSWPHHAAAGWVLADEPAPEAAPADVPPAPVADDPEPTKRRGRTSKEVSD
jgi:hypothetical protein